MNVKECVEYLEDFVPQEFTSLLSMLEGNKEEDTVYVQNKNFICCYTPQELSVDDFVKAFSNK